MTIKAFFTAVLAAGCLYAQEPLRLGDAPEEASFLVDLFAEQTSFFLNESELYLSRNPQSPFLEEILWMRGHTLFRQGDTAQAKLLLAGLTNSSKTEVRHRALFDLSQIFSMESNTTVAGDLLERIRTDAVLSSVQETAAARSLLLRFRRAGDSALIQDIKTFARQYPDSPALGELTYYAALSELQAGNLAAAETFSQNLQGRKGDTVQRLLAEIALQKKNYAKAWEFFRPLSLREGMFQDEALYKCGLIAKLQGNYTDAETSFRRLSEYFPDSLYHTRARSELALVQILLQNYDAALAYYRWESGFTGSRKAEALLKITEIYFVKGDSRSTIRAANRVQREFPYSAYANEALYWLGRTALNDKQFSKGIDIFNTYLIREPLSPKKDEIRIFLGQSHSGLGNQSEARRHYQAVVKESSNKETVFNALLGLGQSYSLENQPARALEYYDQIWKAGGAPPLLKEQALFFAAASRYNLRQNKESAAQFGRFLNDYPKSRFRQEASLALAKLDFKSEKFENVLASEASNLKDKEALSELKELQAQSDFRLERYESALGMFQEARRLTQNTERQTALLLAEAGALRNLNRRKDAVRLYEQYLQALQDRGEEGSIEEVLWNEITLTYIEAGETDKGIQNTETFRRLFPGSVYLSGLYFKLADERYSQKRFREASGLYREARLISRKKDLSTEAALREGWSLDADSRPKDAETAFRLFLKQTNTHAAGGDVLGKLAEYRDQDGDWEGARILREEIVKNYPESPEAEKARIFLAGMIAFSEEEGVFRSAAAQTKDKALKAKILYRLALKYENEGRTDRLLGALWEVRSMNDPVLGGATALKMARATLNAGDARGALNLFITVITDYADKTPDALLGVVESYLALGDPRNAARFSTRLDEQFPGSPQAKTAKAATERAAPNNGG